MKLFCSILCTLGAAWAQLSSSSWAGLPNVATDPAAAPFSTSSLLSDGAARQAALDIGWDLAHALGHSTSIPNAGRTIPEMG